MAIKHTGDTFVLSSLTVNNDIIGQGTYTVGAGDTLTFMHAVGAGQTIELSNQHARGGYGASALRIGDLPDFHGRINLTYTAWPAFTPVPAAERSNVGFILTKWVDSYSYQNDMLKLWQGKTVVEALSLHLQDPYGLTVQSTTGSWIFISPNTPTVRGLDFVHGHPPGLAVHV
jgi:hypothetical protein